MAAQDNLPKTQANKNNVKLKKDMGKWCEFHKSSTHNTSECQAKQSLMAEMRASESDACFDSKSELDKGTDKGKQIIDAEPTPLLPLRKSRRRNQRIQRRQNVSSTPKCG